MKLNKITTALSVALLGTAITAPTFAAEDEKLEGLEVIQVTSTKRTQTMQDIPMSVEAVTGEKLEKNGITDFTDLSTSIPNFTVTNSASDKNITMRGMGSPAGQRAVEQSVSMYVDGVYKPRSKQYFNAFLDVERIEILRGPQSILFGLNSTAGAISVISKSNSGGDDLEGSIRVDADIEYGGFTTTGHVGGGLTDDLGARLVIQSQDTDGYIEGTDDDGDIDSMSGRLTLDWDATSNLNIITKVDFFDTKNNAQMGEGIDILNEDVDNEYPYQTSTPSANRFGVNNGYETDGYNVSVKADYLLGDHTLTAIAGYSDFYFENALDFDGGSEADGALLGDVGTEALSFDSLGNEDFEQTSFELQITSPGGEFFDYIAGLSYHQADTADRTGAVVNAPAFQGLFWTPGIGLLSPGHELDPNDPYNNPVGLGVVEIDQEVISAYFSGTFNLTNTFSITAGGRYVDETKDAERYAQCGLLGDGWNGMVRDDSTDWGDAMINGTLIGIPAVLPAGLAFGPIGRSGACMNATLMDIAAGGPGAFFYGPGSVGKRTVEADNFLPELSAHWKVSDGHMLFARIAKSAKSGGLSSSWATAIEDSTFEEETVVGAEFGIKSRVLDGNAEFNITAFNNKYEDLQVTSFSFGSAKVDNAGEATVTGIEADGKMLVNDWLTIGASLAYLDAEYDEYTGGSCADAPSPSVPNAEGTACDMSGLPLLNSPEFSGNVYADIFYNLTDSLDFNMGVNVSYSDDYYTEAKYITALVQESYSMVGAYIGISDVDEKWSITLKGRNLTDEILTGSGIEINALGLGSVVPNGGSPRMVTLSGQYNF